MKKTILFSAIAALALAGTSFTAYADESETVTIKGEHKIELPQSYSRITADTHHDYQGGYSLSTGQTLSIYARGNRMYAQVDDQPRHELAATGSNSFVSLDQKMEMTINLHDNAEPTGILYMMVPAKAPATAPVAAVAPATKHVLAATSSKTKGKLKTRVAKATVPAKPAQPALPFNGERMIAVAMR
jgi:hypothetical protein